MLAQVAMLDKFGRRQLKSSGGIDSEVMRNLDAFAIRDWLTRREFLNDKVCRSLNDLGENVSVDGL